MPGTRFLKGKLVCPDRQLLFRWDLGNGSQQALLRNAGKQRDRSRYALASATPQPDSRQERKKKGEERQGC